MLRFPSPVLRSKDFSALPVSLPVAGPPNALKSFEQAQSVLDASSAKTPKIEREPAAPGWTNTVLSAARELTRTIPPSPIRPTKSAPSELDVMLSGKAFVPGTGIDSTFWVAASTVKLSTKARKANLCKHRNRLDAVTRPMPLSVERGVEFSDLVAFKQHEIFERISSGQSSSPRSVSG